MAVAAPLVHMPERKGGKRRGRRGKAESRRWCHELCKGTASAAAPYKAMVVVVG